MRRSKIFLGTSWGVRPYERQNKTLFYSVRFGSKKKAAANSMKKVSTNSLSLLIFQPARYHALLFPFFEVHKFSFIEFVIFASQVLTKFPIVSSHGNGFRIAPSYNWERIVHFGRGLRRWTFPWLIVKDIYIQELLPFSYAIELWNRTKSVTPLYSRNIADTAKNTI